MEDGTAPVAVLDGSRYRPRAAAAARWHRLIVRAPTSPRRHQLMGGSGNAHLTPGPRAPERRTHGTRDGRLLAWHGNHPPRAGSPPTAGDYPRMYQRPMLTRERSKSSSRLTGSASSTLGDSSTGTWCETANAGTCTPANPSPSTPTHARRQAVPSAPWRTSTRTSCTQPRSWPAGLPRTPRRRKGRRRPKPEGTPWRAPRRGTLRGSLWKMLFARQSLRPLPPRLHHRPRAPTKPGSRRACGRLNGSAAFVPPSSSTPEQQGGRTHPFCSSRRWSGLSTAAAASSAGGGAVSFAPPTLRIAVSHQ